MSKSPVAARRPHQYTNSGHPQQQQQQYEYPPPPQGLGQQQQQRSPPVNGHAYDDWQHRQQQYSHASQKPQQHQPGYPNLPPGADWGHPHHQPPPPQHLQQQYRYPEESAWAMPPPLPTNHQSQQQQHHHSSSSTSKGSHSSSKHKSRTSNGAEGPSSSSPPRHQGHRKTQSRDFLPPPLPPTGNHTSPGSVSPSARSYGHTNAMMPPSVPEADLRPRSMSSRPVTPPGMRSSGDYAGVHKRKRSEGGHDRYPSMEQPPWARPSHEDMAAASGVSRPHEVRHHSETLSRPPRELEPLAFERESMGPPAQKKSSSSRKQQQQQQQHKQESQSYDSAMPHGLASSRAASHPVQRPPPPHSYHPYEPSGGMLPPARAMEEVPMGYVHPQDGYYPPYGEEGRVRLDGRILDDARPTAVKHSSKAGREKSKGSKDLLAREEQKRLDERQQPRVAREEKALKQQPQQVQVIADYPVHVAPPLPQHQRPAASVEMLPAVHPEVAHVELRPLHPSEALAGPAQLQHPEAVPTVPSIQRHRVISDSVWQWLDEFQGVLPESPSSAADATTPPTAQVPTATYAGTFLYDAYKQPLLPGDLLTRNVASLIEVRIPGSLLGPYRERSDARARRGWTLGWRARHSGVAVDVPAGCKAAQKDDVNSKAIKNKTSPAFWSQPSLSQRKLWGSEVYTDDSDVLAMCLHSGWIEGPSKLSEAMTTDKEVEDTYYWPPPDVKVTLRVAPRLMSYRESYGGGLWSRNWLGTHQGVSLVVERVELQPSGYAEVYKLPGWKGSKINMERLAKERKRIAALEKRGSSVDEEANNIIEGVRSLSVFPLSEARTKIKTAEKGDSSSEVAIAGKDRPEGGDSFWWRSSTKHLLPLTSALR